MPNTDDNRQMIDEGKVLESLKENLLEAKGELSSIFQKKEIPDCTIKAKIEWTIKMHYVKIALSKLRP